MLDTIRTDVFKVTDSERRTVELTDAGEAFKLHLTLCHRESRRRLDGDKATDRQSLRGVKDDYGR